MNPVQLIKQDHRMVKGLFRRFESSSRSSDKQKIGQEIIEELSVHAAIEEQLIYPLLRAHGGMEDPVLNALEEHHALKLTLAELDGMSAEDERYRAKMHVVREAVAMHIEEEERSLLPRLDRALDADDRGNLAAAMIEMKQEAPNHPHPHAPDTPPGAVLSAMLAKIADSGRDFVRSLTNEEKTAGHRRVVRRAKASAKRTRRTRRSGSARSKARRSSRSSKPKSRRSARGAARHQRRTTRRSAGGRRTRRRR